MTKHAQRLIRLAHFQLLLAGLVFLAVVIFVVWPGYQGIVAGQERLTELTEVIQTTESKLDLERDTYRSLKEAYTIQAANNRESIDEIIPTKVEQTEIVRAVEKFTNSLRDSYNPILLKTVHFGKVVKKKDVDYVTLPFKITVNTTKDNLRKLLRYLERSGTFLQPGDGILPRLLEARDITIQINDLSDARRFLGSDQGSVDVDISLNAYALPSTEKKTKQES